MIQDLLQFLVFISARSCLSALEVADRSPEYWAEFGMSIADIDCLAQVHQSIERAIQEQHSIYDEQVSVLKDLEEAQTTLNELDAGIAQKV